MLRTRFATRLFIGQTVGAVWCRDAEPQCQCQHHSDGGGGGPESRREFVLITYPFVRCRRRRRRRVGFRFPTGAATQHSSTNLRQSME